MQSPWFLCAYYTKGKGQMAILFRKKNRQENMREKSREYIRETEGYKKLILSGDGNVSEVLNEPEKIARVLTSVASEVVEKMEQNEQLPQNDEIQKNNEMEMNQIENAPKVLGG